MSIIKKIYKHILILIIFLVGFNSSIDYFFKHQEVNYLKIQTELLQSKYDTQYKYLRIMSNDIYIMYQENKKLIELFAQAKDANIQEQAVIRNKMYKMLHRRYKRLVNMGIKQLHFHLPTNISFLRMHNPSKFGDDLSTSRESIASTNRLEKFNEGFEVGKVANGFRYVYPLFDANQTHIGSVEISFASHQLLENLNNKLIYDKHFIVLKSEVNKNTWVKFITESYIESPENKDYFLELNGVKDKDTEHTHALFKNNKLLDVVSLNISKNKPFSLATKDIDKTVIITFLPINNIDKKIAYIILYSNSDYLNSIEREQHYAKILIFSIIFLLFIFSLYVTTTQHKLREMALFDKLTKLPNRAYFYTELDAEIRHAKRNKEKLAVLFIDLDGFKSINDTYGHDIGDELLIQVARRLKSSIRKVDVVGRIGGDEFTVLVTDVKESVDAEQVAQKIVNSISKDFLIKKHIVKIGASIGISIFSYDAEDVDTIMKHADTAMYVAKNGGKNSFSTYEKKQQ